MEYLSNAEVRLDGTAEVTFAERYGSFKFDHVLAAGPAAITVTYSGYNTVKERIVVAPRPSAGQWCFGPNGTRPAAVRSNWSVVYKLYQFDEYY